MDRKTVRKDIARGVEAPSYGPREPRPQKIDAYLPFLRDRIRAHPQLSAVRLLREIQPLGFSDGYGTVKDAVRELRPALPTSFEYRFETSAGEQAQIDFARFRTAFACDPEQIVTLWLFTLVLGHSRYLWGEFVWHQDPITVLRSHVRAFSALGGVPREILYDRMKTAVLNEVADGIIYNARLRGGSSQDEGQDRAPLPLYPSGLLSEPQLPRSGKPQAQFDEWLATVAPATNLFVLCRAGAQAG